MQNEQRRYHIHKIFQFECLRGRDNFGDLGVNGTGSYRLGVTGVD
jgi:hypothetical protein